MERTAMLKKEADLDGKQLSGWAQRTAGKASEGTTLRKSLNAVSGGWPLPSRRWRSGQLPTQVALQEDRLAAAQ